MTADAVATPRFARLAIGRRVYSLGAVALGLVTLAFGGISPDWLPVPAHLPGGAALAVVAAGALIIAGLAINLPRTAAAASLALAALFAAGTLAFEAPYAATKPTDWSGWQAIAESTAMALGGVLAWSRSRSAAVSAVAEARAIAVARHARRAFGVCLLIFGVSHFVYASFTASMVPAWLPPSPRFWTYLTGAAQIAAGLAMLSRVWARLAAILLTAMYLLFSALAHIPAAIAAPSNPGAWAENAINLLLIGAAWTLADSLTTARPRGWGGEAAA